MMRCEQAGPLRVLLLSAYHSASHAYWCEGMMQAFPEVEWVLKTQPARHFSWRVRASGWIWAQADDADFERDYDLIIATSLTGLHTLKAQYPALQSVPTWVYFHENQFAHPLEERQQVDHQISWQFSSLENALCADWISFNTAFNRATFFKGLRQMLKRMPERLSTDPVAMLEAKSDVLPVPLSDALSHCRNAEKDLRLIVWNHRWEWDKQPALFLKALIELSAEGIDFRLAMMGYGGGREDAFAAERQALKQHILHWGEASVATYRAWVQRAGIGVSCALHDFQGLAMLELAQAGAVTVVPRRVAYPECLPGAVFYEGSARDPAKELTELRDVLRAELKEGSGRMLPLDAIPCWTELRGRYAGRMTTLATCSGIR